MRSCAFNHIPSRTTWRFSLSRPYLPGALTSKLSSLLFRTLATFQPEWDSNPCLQVFYMRLAKGPTLAQATLPFHMPLCSGSGNQLFTHISRLNGRGVRRPMSLGAGRVPAHSPLRFWLLQQPHSRLQPREWQFIIISRYTVYFRTLGAIYTSKGSVTVCSPLKLGSRGVYVPLDTPTCLFRYFYSAFYPWWQTFALRALKSGAPALRPSCPTGVFQTNDAQSLPPESYS